MDQNQTIIDRLNRFLQVRNISRAEFADTCGIPRPTVTQILSGRNKKISNDIINAVHVAYPDVSVMWLLFGEGEEPDMDKPGEGHASKPSENSIFPDDSIDDSENAILQAPKIEENSDNRQFVNMLYPKKEIVKIVVFFSDNSFEEFYAK